MQRREARLRKEYLYRKSLEEKEQRLHDQKMRLKSALENSENVPADIKKETVSLAKQLTYDDGLEGKTRLTFAITYLYLCRA